MLALAFNWMVNGRLLFIIKRAQLKAFCDDMKSYVKKFGSKFMYTHSKEFWYQKDETTGEFVFNIVIVCEDELATLQGILSTSLVLTQY